MMLHTNTCKTPKKYIVAFPFICCKRQLLSILHTSFPTCHGSILHRFMNSSVNEGVKPRGVVDLSKIQVCSLACCTHLNSFCMF
jgi:hypothetical protein